MGERVTGRLRTSSMQSVVNAHLEEEIKYQKLKQALRDAKSGGSAASGGSGGGSGGGSSAMDNRAVEDQRLREARDYETSQRATDFERTRTLQKDRADQEAAASADRTAQLIRERQEASDRGARLRRATSGARR